MPIDTFTLDDGWNFHPVAETGLWGHFDPQRFPGGLPPLLAAGRTANIGISLWWGPIGGYTYRPARVEFGRKMGYEIYGNGGSEWGDKLCTAGRRYHEHVLESFSKWVGEGVDYLKVDGFWPECPEKDHGHPVGPAGAIAQMDSLASLFDAWRKVRPTLLIGYTSGSNPSPFWLQHADYLWRGGRDDDFAGVGPAIDRQNTYLDCILQLHRRTDMPASGFVTFDLVESRLSGSDEEAFRRGCWWMAARATLHHDWYVQPNDLTPAEWKVLAEPCKWAKRHERLFRFSRMFGGDPSKGEVYGFSAYDGGKAVLAIRNPTDEPRSIDGNLHDWLDLPDAVSDHTFGLDGVFGHTASLEGKRAAGATLHLELPPLGIAVFEAKDVEGL